MDLRLLNFGHIKGFTGLSEKEQDEFITLLKQYIQSVKPELRGLIQESNMTAVYVTKQHHYRISFFNQPDILLTPGKHKKRSHAGIKGGMPSVQVPISIDIHEALKEQAEKEGMNIRGLMDKACSDYLNFKS